MSPTVVLHADHVRGELIHVHQLLVADERLVGVEDHPTGQLRARRRADHADPVAALRRDQAGHLRPVRPVAVASERLAVRAGVAEIVVQRVRDARRQVRMNQFNSQIGHGHHHSFAPRVGPGRADVQVRAGHRAVGVTLFQIPLFGEILIVGLRRIRAVQRRRLAHDRVTGQNFRLRGKSPGLARGGGRVRGLKNETVAGDHARQGQWASGQQTPQAVCGLNVENHAAAEFHEVGRAVLRPAFHPFNFCGRSLPRRGALPEVIHGRLREAKIKMTGGAGSLSPNCRLDNSQSGDADVKQ